MSTTTQKAAEALELLPEDMREPAIAYIIEQAEKFQELKKAVEEGVRDAEAGNVREWNFAEFLRDARKSSR